MQINKTTLKQFRQDFAATVKQLEAQYECQIQLGNISYSLDQFTSKITVKSGGSNEEIERRDFAKAASLFGLKADQYGAEIRQGSEVYRLIGFNLRAKKRPILIKNVRTGKTFACMENAIVTLQMEAKSVNAKTK